MPSPSSITVVTPTILGREDLLDECKTSVAVLGLPHLIGLDVHCEGPAVIRNRLLEQVDTEWVLFLDDDDLLYPNYVAVVADHLADADIAYTSWALSGAGDPMPHTHFDPELLTQRNFIPVTACVRAEALRAVGGFPLIAHEEDHALWKTMLAADYRFHFVPVIAWHYRRRPNSRSLAE